MWRVTSLCRCLFSMIVDLIPNDTLRTGYLNIWCNWMNVLHRLGQNPDNRLPPTQGRFQGTNHSWRAQIYTTHPLSQWEDNYCLQWLCGPEAERERMMLRQPRLKAAAAATIAASTPTPVQHAHHHRDQHHCHCLYYSECYICPDDGGTVSVTVCEWASESGDLSWNIGCLVIFFPFFGGGGGGINLFLFFYLK